MNESYSHYYAVIMAGGGGTRLWPVSRRDHPKQVMHFDKERTLFEIAVDRLDGMFPPERILVVTVDEQAKQLMKICPQIPQKNFLIEPFPRGTASVVGLSAIFLQALDEQATMVILTADHFIENVPEFQELLKSAFAASQENRLVTLGIEPTFPSTGYGYIQRGELLGQYRNKEVFVVERFTEKPELDVAQSYLEEGKHDWNSGMFIWKTDVILDEFSRQMPDLNDVLLEIQKILPDPAWNDKITDLWGKIRPQTIDYGIMENARDVAVIPAKGLGWSDLGSWDSLYDILPADEEGNIIHHPDHIGLDTKNTILFSQNSPRLVVTIGLEDLIIIETEDALLVCPRERAQEVKEVVNLLKKQKREKYI